MTHITKEMASCLAVAVLLLTAACQKQTATNETAAVPEPSAPVMNTTQPEPPPPPPTPEFPDLQAQITDDRFKNTNSPLGNFDFRNFTYPLPRGWQHRDGTELVLENGRVKPVSEYVDEDMSNEEQVERKAARRIGMSYVTTRFLDATGDGNDEAIVILKVETAGSAIPQIVYIFEWKDEKPELLWHFRTGDRADGGLKDLRSENGELVVELYGQDRFLLGETETGKITGDEEQLCCPTHFTRSVYKWNGRDFLMRGKRLTFELANPSAKPLENYGEIVNNPKKTKK